MSGKFMSPGTPEYVEAQKAKEDEARARRAKEIANERRQWVEARAIYEQSLLLVEAVWSPRLDAAQFAQQQLAEEMRDRGPNGAAPLFHVTDAITTATGEQGAQLLTAEIPVPLFTPRDRVQFLKEATTAFLIFGEKRGLQALPKEAPAEQPEAASGAGEEAGEVALAEGTE